MKKRSVACKIRSFQYPFLFSFHFRVFLFHDDVFPSLLFGLVFAWLVSWKWSGVSFPSIIYSRYGLLLFYNGSSKLLFWREMIFLGHVERYKLDHRVINASQGFQLHPTSSIFLLLGATD